MSIEERFMDLIERSTDKQMAVETAIEVFLCLLKQSQTEQENAPEIQAKQTGTSVA